MVIRGSLVSEGERFEYAFRFPDGAAVMWNHAGVVARGRVLGYGYPLTATEGSKRNRERLVFAWRSEWL